MRKQLGDYEKHNMEAKKLSSIRINAIMNAVLTMSTFIFAVVTFPYASRVILPEGTGKVSFAKSVIAYFAIFAQLGIPTYGVRECAKIRDDKKKLSKLVHELFALNVVTSVISLIVFFVLLFTVPKFSQERVLLLVTSTTILFNCIGIEWLYQALEMYSYITIRSIVFKAVAILLMLLLVTSKEDYIIYGGILVFGTYASSLINFLYIHKIIKINWKEGIDLRPHLKAVLVFFGMTCATIIYTNLDNVMLGFMKTSTDVGYYDAAIKVKNILTSVVSSLGIVLLPRTSFYIKNGRIDDFARLTKKAMNLVVLLALPLTLYFLLFSRESILLLSGSEYESAIIPMMIILPTVLFIGMSNITGIEILVPLGKEKYVLYSEIVGAIVDFTINLLLIPRFGATGAAVGTLIAEFVVWLFQYLSLKRDLKDVYSETKFIKILLALFISLVFSTWVKLLNLGNFLTLFISGMLFFVSYYIVLIVSKEKLVVSMSKDIFNKIRRK